MSKSQINGGLGSKKRGNGLVYFILVVLFFSLYFNQWVTLEKLSNMINPISQFGTFSDFFKFLNQYGSRIFDGMDSFVMFLIILSGVSLIFMEIKGKRISGLIESQPKTDRRAILWLVIIGLFSMRYYFAAGTDTYIGDSPYFYFLASHITESFKQGIIFPYWTNIHGCGAPANQFYAPLHSYVAAFFNLITGNLHVSIKISLFLFHMAGVVGVYLFIRELTGSKRVGFFAGFATMLMYYHPHMIIFPGRYGEGAIWGCYPFLFYFFEKFLNSRKWRDVLLMALTIGIIVLSNIGMSFYFFLFWGIYVIVRILLLDCPVMEKGKIIGMLAVAAIIGLIICGYYLYSQVKEGLWSMGDKASSNKAEVIEPYLIPATFVWNNYQVILFNVQRVWQSAYFGISLLVLSFFGFFYSMRKGDRRFIPVVVLFAAGLFIFLGYGHIGFFKKVPYLYTYAQSRFLNILAFAVLFLSGIGVYGLMKMFPGKRVLVIVLLLVAIDLFPTTFHDTWGNNYAGAAAPFFEKLKQEHDAKPGELLNYRVELLGNSASRSVRIDWRSYDAFMAITGVPLVKEMQWDYNRLRFFTEYVNLLVFNNDPRFSVNILMGYLSFYNVKYLLSSFSLPPQLFKSYQQNGGGQDVVGMAEMKYVSPMFLTYSVSNVVFNTNMVVKYLEGLRIDGEKLVYNRIWIKNGKTEHLPVSQQTLQVLDHHVRDHSARLRVILKDKAFAVLSYSAYPTVRLFVDGKPMKYFETAQATMLFPLEPGEHVITIRSSRTKGAFLTFLMGILVSLFTIGFLSYPVIKNKRKKEVIQ